MSRLEHIISKLKEVVNTVEAASYGCVHGVVNGIAFLTLPGLGARMIKREMSPPTIEIHYNGSIDNIESFEKTLSKMVRVEKTRYMVYRSSLLLGGISSIYWVTTLVPPPYSIFPLTVMASIGLYNLSKLTKS